MFTKEEISLCKQVAEKYVKSMEYGDWWQDAKKEVLLCLMKKWIMSRDVVKKGNFPLWTISDCLEFLRERKWHISHCFEAMNKKYHSFMIKIAENHVSSEDSRYRDAIGETLLEACLKAVLAVIEEKE